VKATLAFLRMRALSTATERMDIHKHPAVVKIELDLQRKFKTALHNQQVSDVN